MNARQFLQAFRPDERVATGAFFDAGGLDVRPGDHVGVALTGLGGPHDRSEIEHYLYSRWMDPVLYAGTPRLGRHRISTIASRLAGRYFWRDYEEVGGNCPSNRLIGEQATALEAELQSRLGPGTKAIFSTHVATRYGSPSIDDACARMAARGVTKAVLLPTHPQYSIATTGTSLAYWSSLLADRARVPIQFSSVVEYSVHPLYLQALSERIDQALQRFPKRMRNSVEILFCAEHAEVYGKMSNRDSFCDLARTTVDRLSELRAERRKSRVVCFRSGVRTGRSDEREMRSALQQLREQGADSVLIVPLGLSTDHVWTAYTLDIFLRSVSMELGIARYEVAAGLNCHPLFISALVDVVAAQLKASHWISNPARRNRPRTSSSFRESERVSECPTCKGPVRARDWESSFRGAAKL